MTYEEFRAAFLLVFGEADKEDGLLCRIHISDPSFVVVDVPTGHEAKLYEILPQAKRYLDIDGAGWQQHKIPLHVFR